MIRHAGKALLCLCAWLGSHTAAADICLPNPDDTTAGTLRDPLVYARRVDTLTGDALQDEYEAAAQSLLLCPTDAQRLRVVLVLDARHAAPGGEYQALALLEEILRDNSDLSALASLMANGIAKQQRLETQQQSLEKKLRQEEARATALQQKLDALKAIEQQLQQRQAPQMGAQP